MFGGFPAEVFDLTTAHVGNESTTYREWTVVLFREAALPAFECLPKDRDWATSIERCFRPAVRFFAQDGTAAGEAVAAFDRTYQLSPADAAFGWPEPTDEGAVRELFRPSVLAALAMHPEWRVQSADGELLCARRGFARGKERERLCREAIEIFDALRTTPDPAEPVLPCPPGRETGRQKARMAATAVGGVIGGILGFVVSFAVFMAFPLGPGGLGGPVGFFGSVFGGLFAGITLGACLGRTFGGRSYWAGQDEKFFRPAPRGHQGWMVGGAFAGWFVGGAVAMVLTMLIAPQGAAWTAPLLIYLPPTAGLILGGTLGSRYASRRESRRIRTSEIVYEDQAVS